MLDLEKFGVLEMNAQEIVEVEGGELITSYRRGRGGGCDCMNEGVYGFFAGLLGY